MFKQAFSIVGVLCFGIGCSSQPTMTQLGGKPSPDIMKIDNRFFKNITEATLTEDQSSQLALAQSQNPSLKKYAQQMIDDHMAGNSRVMEVAAQKQVVVPKDLDPDHQKMIDDLKTKTGTDFDKAYIDLQVSAHQQLIDAATDEQSNGSDPDVRKLASHVQDAANKHLRMAMDLQGSR